MELLKNVSKWGNSAGVLLPREWVGSQVKIVLIDRTSNIKKEVFNILDEYLHDILGIYLVGSYARGEQEENSDIDVVAISKQTKKEINSGKYNVSIITLESAKKTIKKNPILILPRLYEAKPLLNQMLLEELKAKEISRRSFREYLIECKRIISINKGLINLDKERNIQYLDSPEIIYSIMLRLRGLFLIFNLLKKKSYSTKVFLNWLKDPIGEKELRDAYEIYKSIRDNKKTKLAIKVETADRLIGFLQKEVDKYETKEKA